MKRRPSRQPISSWLSHGVLLAPRNGARWRSQLTPEGAVEDGLFQAVELGVRHILCLAESPCLLLYCVQVGHNPPLFTKGWERNRGAQHNSRFQPLATARSSRHVSAYLVKERSDTTTLPK